MDINFNVAKNNSLNERYIICFLVKKNGEIIDITFADYDNYY